MPLERELEDDVERQLRESRISYQKSPVVGDTQPDFLITTDRGHQIVVEVKSWSADAKSTARAVQQVRRYKELSNTAAALLVVAAGKTVSLPEGGVAPVASFLKSLNELAASLESRPARRVPVKPRGAPRKLVFVSMPFAAQYDDTFLVAIQPAALSLGAAAARVDHSGRGGDVVRQIKEMIEASKAVVADLSESRPNVCHEVGFAEALDRPVVQICSTPLTSLPFNLRNNRTRAYTIGQTSRLRRRLEEELAKVL